MTKEYSKEEINQLLLSKKLNEFYLAIIENRQEPLSKEEYENFIRKNNTIFDYDKEPLNEHLKNFIPELMKITYSLMQVRYLAILTMIDDNVYDIGNPGFLDLNKNKIIHFDNFTTLYNESNARIRYFTKEEEPQLKEKTVLIDVDDESIIRKYEKEHINQIESEDLTNDFFNEINGKPYILKK